MDRITIYKIDTQFGSIYIEPLVGTREEKDRIKIFDSNTNYIDYILVETLSECATEQKISIEEEYVKRIKTLHEAETIRDLLESITQDWITITKNPFELQERLDIHCADEKQLLHEIINNDYVNQIGNYYILMEE